MDVKTGSILLVHRRNTTSISKININSGLEIIFQENGPKEQVGIAVLISDKTDFKRKLIRRDRKRHYILIRGKIHQHLYPNTRAPKFVEETPLQPDGGGTCL